MLRAQRKVWALTAWTQPSMPLRQNTKSHKILLLWHPLPNNDIHYDSISQAAFFLTWESSDVHLQLQSYQINEMPRFYKRQATKLNHLSIRILTIQNATSELNTELARTSDYLIFCFKMPSNYTYCPGKASGRDYHFLHLFPCNLILEINKWNQQASIPRTIKYKGKYKWKRQVKLKRNATVKSHFVINSITLYN